MNLDFSTGVAGSRHGLHEMYEKLEDAKVLPLMET